MRCPIVLWVRVLKVGLVVRRRIVIYSLHFFIAPLLYISLSLYLLCVCLCYCSIIALVCCLTVTHTVPTGVCGWGQTPAQRSYFRSGADVHKTLAVVNNTHRAHIRALCRSHILELHRRDQGVTMRKANPSDEFEKFWEKIHSVEYQKGDAQFQHLLFFYVDTIVPALLLMHTAQRLNEFWYYTAASLTLMPLFYVRNNIKYGPYLLEDAALWLHQVPRVILNQKIVFFTHQGQSTGAILEQFNKKMKHTVARESEIAFKVGSGGLEQMTDMRNKLCSIARVTQQVSQEHSEISYEMDVDAIVGLLVRGKAYEIVEGRSVEEVRTADNKDPLHSKYSNSVSMYSSGVTRIAEASLKLKLEQKYKFESAIAIVSREVGEVGEALVVEDGENEDDNLEVMLQDPHPH